MTATGVELVRLGRSDLEIAVPSEDVTGRVVLDPHGLRVGVVEDVIIDVHQRRARLLSVVSGGVAGLATSRVLLPVEAVTPIGDQLRVDLPYAEVQARGASTRGPH